MKTVILIQTGIHSREIEGKDASLMLFYSLPISNRIYCLTAKVHEEHAKTAKMILTIISLRYLCELCGLSLNVGNG
ncbi:MAG: hypothetical protein KKF20_01470 [Bacteroidetes bacterium]|nr:hypothetical protein [Bacteroidota bacterium]MBU1422330.1 hypothetical protein [Bacteroidota bacterium]MBU2471063.1 hypothetical protein [Bacteroidota bacterium]